MNKEEIIVKIAGDTKIREEYVTLIINSFLEILTKDSLNNELTKIEKNKNTTFKYGRRSTVKKPIFCRRSIPKQINVVYSLKNINDEIQLEIKSSSVKNQFSAKMGGDGGGANE